MGKYPGSWDPDPGHPSAMEYPNSKNLSTQHMWRHGYSSCILPSRAGLVPHMCHVTHDPCSSNRGNSISPRPSLTPQPHPGHQCSGHLWAARAIPCLPLLISQVQAGEPSAWVYTHQGLTRTQMTSASGTSRGWVPCPPLALEAQVLSSVSLDICRSRQVRSEDAGAGAGVCAGAGGASIDQVREAQGRCPPVGDSVL